MESKADLTPIVLVGPVNYCGVTYLPYVCQAEATAAPKEQVS